MKPNVHNLVLNKIKKMPIVPPPPGPRPRPTMIHRLT